MKKRGRPSLAVACGQYVHRYTMEHVPDWATKPHIMKIAGQEFPTAKFYAPQFRTDAEWYANTKFPGEAGWIGLPKDTNCYTTGQTWPLGHWLDAPFKRR